MRPIHKLYYNLTITLVSVAVAVLIGGIETLGLLADQFKFKGGFWDLTGTLNDNFNNLGFVIIGVFVFARVALFLIYRAKGYDNPPTFQSGKWLAFAGKRAGYVPLCFDIAYQLVEQTVELLALAHAQRLQGVLLVGNMMRKDFVDQIEALLRQTDIHTAPILRGSAPFNQPRTFEPVKPACHRA